MKKQRKFQRLKNYIYSGRFCTRLILLLVVLPGFIFTKKAIKADGIELLPEGELMERLESLEEDPAILSEKKAVLTLDGYPLPYDEDDNIWYVAQNPEIGAWEGVPGLGGRDTRLYLLDDGYMKKKQDSIREGHIFRAAVVKGNAYALTNITVSGMPVISIETRDSW